jgi:hypothetical protein
LVFRGILGAVGCRLGCVRLRRYKSFASFRLLLGELPLGSVGQKLLLAILNRFRRNKLTELLHAAFSASLRYAVNAVQNVVRGDATVPKTVHQVLNRARADDAWVSTCYQGLRGDSGVYIRLHVLWSTNRHIVKFLLTLN